MMLTKRWELSGYFDVLGAQMVRRFCPHRTQAVAVYGVLRRSAVDLSHQRCGAVYHRALSAHPCVSCAGSVSRLIIFEALAVARARC